MGSIAYVVMGQLNVAGHQISIDAKPNRRRVALVMMKVTQLKSLRMCRHDGIDAGTISWLPQVGVRRESGLGTKEA